MKFSCRYPPFPPPPPTHTHTKKVVENTFNKIVHEGSFNIERIIYCPTKECLEIPKVKLRINIAAVTDHLDKDSPQILSDCDYKQC